MNASILLRPVVNLTQATVVNVSAPVVIDIGTDPLCEDDLNGTLATLEGGGYTCTAAVDLVGCGYDMSANADSLPDGTLVSDLCPKSCDTCACRPP
jgi:hypothetical protein